jgi:hypothetical protein
MTSTKNVLDHYIGKLIVADLFGILANYEPSAVLFSPHGFATRTEAIAAFFKTVLRNSVHSRLHCK